MSLQSTKLSLSKEGLQYVIQQIQNDMTSKLNLHLPADTTENDTLKRKVAALLDDFVGDALDMAKHLLIVDGHDMANETVPLIDMLSVRSTEQTEPFDTQLNDTLKQLIGQVEAETTELAYQRRLLPKQAGEAYKDLVGATDLEVSRIIAELDAEDDGVGEEHVMPNRASILADYEKSLTLLSKLKEDLPATLAELNSLDLTMRFLELRYKDQQRELG